MTEWWAAARRVGSGQRRAVDRGLELAQRGRVSDLDVEPGRVEVDVRWQPRDTVRVRVRIPTISGEDWEGVAADLASAVVHVAELEEGQVPSGLADLLARRGVRLELDPDEVVVDILSDADSMQVTAARAAALAAIAAAVDRDPSLHLAIRGCSLDRLLASVRGLRRGDEPAISLPPGDPFRARGDLDAVPLHPHAPGAAAAVLDSLGTPPADAEALLAAVRRAASVAWQLASGEGEEAAGEAVVVAELRARGSASAATLADALGFDAGSVEVILEDLHGSGQVLRSGIGPHARYRASPG